MTRVYTSPSRISALLAATAVACAAAALPARADETSVFFCPSKLLAPGQRMKGIMCSSEACYNAASSELSPAQRAFLDKSEQPCRSLTQQEVQDLWPKPLAATSQQAAK